MQPTMFFHEHDGFKKMAPMKLKNNIPERAECFCQHSAATSVIEGLKVEFCPHGYKASTQNHNSGS